MSEEHVLESRRRLSSSILWRMQRSFFERQGLRAWTEGGVPHYITSSAWIADAYARVVLGWLRDCAGTAAREPSSFAPLDLRHPVHIVELGCGTGRFSFLFLNRLLDLLDRSPLRPVRIRYVLTDFMESNLDSLRDHPSLRAYIEAGLVDFARYDAAAPAGGDTGDEFRLLCSGEVLSARTLRNPLIVLANYVFDSIPQDAFALRGGRLFESLVTVAAPSEPADPGDPTLLPVVRTRWEEQPAADEPYGDPDLDGILHEYAERLDDMSFLFPCAALRCVQSLARLSDGRLLLLSGDKGASREELIDQGGPPELAHHGSFSLMVSYHSVGRWFERQGGVCLGTSHLHSSLCVVSCLLGTPPGGLIETRLAFDEAIERRGPDDFFDLKRGLEKGYDSLDVEELLAWIRLSGWDAGIFLGCAPVLMKHAGTASGLLRREIHRAVHEVWSAHFPLPEVRDLAFELGVLLCEIQCYEDALGFFRQSAGLHGSNPATVFNMGLCLFHLGDLEAARVYTQQAIDAAPDYAPAAALREEIAAAARFEDALP